LFSSTDIKVPSLCLFPRGFVLTVSIPENSGKGKICKRFVREV
jgi:hypothetical protein